MVMRTSTQVNHVPVGGNSPGSPVESLVDVATAATRLGVTVRFVRRLVAERRIPYLKVGKFIRFDPAEVEQWIDDNQVGQLSLW